MEDALFTWRGKLRKAVREQGGSVIPSERLSFWNSEAGRIQRNRDLAPQHVCLGLNRKATGKLRAQQGPLSKYLPICGVT